MRMTATGQIDLLSDEQMLGPFFKEFADLGHWFNSAHQKCVRCGCYTIDLYEDGWYGEVRRCRADSQTEPIRATTNLQQQEGLMPQKQSSDELSSLAAKVLGGYQPTRDEIEALAGSVWSQDETKGSRNGKPEQPAPEDPDHLTPDERDPAAAPPEDDSSAAG